MNPMLDDTAPDWRWGLVVEMVGNNEYPSRREEDAWLRRACHYLKRFNQRSPVEKWRLKHDYPNLYRAHSLNANSDSVKWMIEAGLLTGVDITALAEYVGESEEVVREYATLFYDVSDKLNAKGYILNRIMLPALQRGAHGHDSDFLFKTLAYCCGWDELKSYLNKGLLSKDMEGFFVKSTKQQVIKNAWTASHRLEINNYNAVAVMDLALRLMEMEKAIGPHDTNKTQVMLNDLLNQCRLAIIPSTASMQLHEPRSDEMVHGVKRLKYGDPIPIKATETLDGKA